MFALNEIIEHAALYGAGAIESVERGKVFQAAWLILAQNVAHALGFKLKDPAGEGLTEDLVTFGIVKREIFKNDLRAVALLDQLHWRRQSASSVVRPRKSILSRPKFIEPVHVVFGYDFVAIGLIKRDDGFKRNR